MDVETIPHSKPPKNLLAICIGIICRNSRERRKWTYDEFSNLTDIKSSYIQSFETANSTFHVSKSYDVYKAFHDYKNVEQYTLEGFISIFSLISIIEAKTKDYVEAHIKESKEIKDISQLRYIAYCKGAHQTCSNLVQESSKYKLIFSKFFSYNLFFLPVQEATKIIESEKIFIDIETYLRQTGAIELDEYKHSSQVMNTYFSQVPSLYMKFVKTNIDNISFLPKKIAIDEVLKWLREDYYNVDEILYVVKDIDFFLYRERIKSFLYSQLMNFNSMCSIYIFGDYDRGNIKGAINDYIKDFISKSGDINKEHMYEKLSKINIHIVKGNEFYDAFTFHRKGYREAFSLLLKRNNSYPLGCMISKSLSQDMLIHDVTEVEILTMEDLYKIMDVVRDIDEYNKSIDNQLNIFE